MSKGGSVTGTCGPGSRLRRGYDADSPRRRVVRAFGAAAGTGPRPRARSAGRAARAATGRPAATRAGRGTARATCRSDRPRGSRATPRSAPPGDRYLPSAASRSARPPPPTARSTGFFRGIGLSGPPRNGYTCGRRLVAGIVRGADRGDAAAGGADRPRGGSFGALCRLIFVASDCRRRLDGISCHSAVARGERAVERVPEEDDRRRARRGSRRAVSGLVRLRRVAAVDPREHHRDVFARALVRHHDADLPTVPAGAVRVETSMSQPRRRRDSSPRNIHVARPRRRRDSFPRNIHVARPRRRRDSSAECPRGESTRSRDTPADQISAAA